MKPFIRKSLAVAVAATVAMSFIYGDAMAYGGIPVIDIANLSQTTMTATENVAQTLKQIKQYQTQLQQYENMLQNTTAPKQQIWDAAMTTMNQLRSSIDTLNYYKRVLGGIDEYLGKFKDTAAYRNSPCYSVGNCSPAQWASLREDEKYGSESQKKATDALFIGLDHQQDNMVADAAQLQRLQSAAQGADGQLQAIGYANQLASHQSNQLLQIRGLLIAQQNVLATRLQAQADNEAKQQAASDKHFAVPGPSNRSNDRVF